MTQYETIQARLAQGWNTWNTRSVLSHVLLPEGFAVNLGIKEYRTRKYLGEAYIGQIEPEQEKVHPGRRTYDGSYTELELAWQVVEVTVRSATVGEDLVILVTPKSRHRMAPALVVEPGILWNLPGHTYRENGRLIGKCGGKEIAVYVSGELADDPYIPAKTGYLALSLSQPAGISTGSMRSVDEIEKILDTAEHANAERIAGYGDLSETYSAMQTCLAWDTVYDPEKQRVISPVSRRWNIGWGGYVLFDWDTYFASYIASVDNPDLAYANAVEMTREKTEQGFIPNFASVVDIKSRDRSQPPVGSLIVREIYRNHGGEWFLEEVFDDLLTWNRWWSENRAAGEDGLCWGSHPYEPIADARFETQMIHDRQGAAFESGLDNSPMYDDVPFNKESCLMELADVGLNGLYVMDCEALSDIASILGKESESAELQSRAATFRAVLQGLWNEDSGIYLNRRTDTGEWSPRLSPTNFYALLGHAPDREKAARMMKKHFYSADEFWGDWILPSIARSDPAYADQSYWRGRIWAPMNLLVYIGLRYYGLTAAQRDLAKKSKDLLLKEWRENGHVHENYNADTGTGCDVPNSDGFYHWGGLLGLISFIEEGYLEAPENHLS